MTAILNHANQLDAQRKQAAFMAKQDNYKELLSKVGDFARADKTNPKAGDELSSAHLASWAFGDLKVLESTNKFQKRPDQETLVNLLEAVRDSLGYHEYLPSTDFVRDRDKYDPGVLFPGGSQRTIGIDEPPKEEESASESPSKEIEEQPQKALEEKVDKLQDKVDQVASILAQQALEDKIDQVLSEELGIAEEVRNKANSQESEVAKREHNRSHIDTRPRPSPQEEASKDTEAQELPVSGAQPDTGREEKHEPASHPRWKFWK